MSSRGPKMVEESYGLAGNDRKCQEQSGDHGGRRRCFSGPIRERPAAVGREIFPS